MRFLEKYRICICNFGFPMTKQICFKIKDAGYKAIYFNYVGVPKQYTKNAEAQNLFWKKESHGLSSISVAEEGINLVYKWFNQNHFRLELQNKKALLLGSEGHIGTELKRILNGFETIVMGFDTANYTCTKTKLSNWLKVADFIFICTPESHDPVLGEKEFSLMKNNPLIINVSGRSALVNKKVLHEYLDKGLILGYTADHEAPNLKEYCKSEMQVNKCFYQKHQGATTIEATKRRFLEKEKNLKELNTIIISNKK